MLPSCHSLNDVMRNHAGSTPVSSSLSPIVYQSVSALLGAHKSFQHTQRVWLKILG